jgi:hypothetical protein
MSSCAGGRGALGGGVGRRRVGRRPLMAHDLMAPARMQRQDPMLEEEVGVGPGCQCGQLGEELEALEEAVDCPGSRSGTGRSRSSRRFST